MANQLRTGTYSLAPVASLILTPMDPTRSYSPITKADLRHLARIAEEEREDFFSRHPEWSILYGKRVLGSALAGDAALHYVNGATGLKEFGVWTFYAEHPDAPFPFQRMTYADFGKSKFGRAPDLPETYQGRRVELQGRSIDALPGDDTLWAVQQYLKAGASISARELSSKGIILLEPDVLLGIAAWPTLALS